MKKLSEQDIKNLITKFNRCLESYSKRPAADDSCTEILVSLTKHYLALLSENKMLREHLFDAEQQLPEEHQWQNILAAKLQLAINSQEKSRDHLEIISSINNEPYIITIQKKFGNSPGQLLKKSEIRRLKAVKKITNLQKMMKELVKTIESQSRVVDAYKMIFFEQEKSLEGLAEQREILAKAYDLLKYQAGKYNIRVTSYLPSLKEAPTSCFQSIQEAWQAAGRESNRAYRLQREVDNLKNYLGRLKRGYVLYNKKRGTY
jgi:DNA repair exonuclease SbcCD ATPase subunit